MFRRVALLTLLTVCAASAAGKTKKGKGKKDTPAETVQPEATPPVEKNAPEPEPSAPPASAPAALTPSPTVLPAPAAAAEPKSANERAAASGKPRLIVMALTPAGGVEPAIAQSLTESVASDVEKAGYFQVTSQKDFAVLLGLERQKQLMGCSDESSSCVSELAGALGARFVLSGTLARLGDAYQLSLQTLDSNKAATLGRSTRIANDLKTLRDLAPWALAEATATPPPTPPSKVLPVTLMSVGGASLLGAGVVFFQSFSREESSLNELRLAQTQPQLQLKPAEYYRGEAGAVVQLRVISAILAGAGAGLVATGFFIYPSSSSSGAQVSLLPTGTGAALVGVWP